MAGRSRLKSRDIFLSDFAAMTVARQLPVTDLVSIWRATSRGSTAVALGWFAQRTIGPNSSCAYTRRNPPRAIGVRKGMKALAALSVCFLTCSARAVDVDDFFDRLDRALTVTTSDNNLRARLSGTLDLEVYHFEQPAPGLIDGKIDNLFNPRLSLFLDAQYGSQVYFFAQSRLDRGFDPSDHGAQIRLDEYALRFTPWEDGRFNLQIGKFATVIGNWVPRHLSWENPFVDAPLVYENITPVSDKSAPASPLDFVRRFEASGKYEFNPVIWGPSYASGVSVSGRLGQFDYAAEMKNSPLMSRPESWNVTDVGFDNPAFNARVGYRPDQAWNLGLSAGEGAYFRREAEQTLPND